MDDGIATYIHGYRIDVAIVTYLDIGQVEIPGLDEVQVNRSRGTVACDGHVLDVGVAC